MTPLVVLVSLLGLLLSPGPTNTLMALGGAVRGFRASLPLIGAALAGYAVVITPLALVGRPYLEAHPHLALVVRGIAAVWILVLAIRLWAAPAGPGERLVTAGGVFVTTLLNPKALVIGLTLLPATTPLRLLPWLGLLAVTVAIVSVVWIAAGALLGRATAGQLPPQLRRVIAVYLGIIALGLVASML